MPYLAGVYRTAAADEVDHSNRLVGTAVYGRVAGMPARCVPHAAVALQSIPMSNSTQQDHGTKKNQHARDRTFTSTQHGMP